jgi:hypothetical protein
VTWRRAAAVFLWWCALWGLWFAFQGEWNRIEWVAAACAATVASVLAALVASRGLLDARVPLTWIGRAWKVPLQVVIDFGIITLALGRAGLRRDRVGGRFVARPFADGADSSAGRGVRGFASVAATYSPNAYVVDIDTERDLVLLHDLVVHPPSEEPATS